MNQFVPWIQVTISGFVYSITLLFLILFIAKKFDLSFGSHLRDYIPYIAILGLFFSYVVGYSAHLVVENLIYTFFSEHKLDVAKLFKLQRENSEKLYTSYENTYADLIMFRHLFISTILFSLSIFYWLRKSKWARMKWYSLIICLGFALIFWIAYSVQKEMFIKINNTLMCFNLFNN